LAIPYGELAVTLLTAEAIVGLLVALWPSGRWSPRRRSITGVVAFLCLILMIPGPILNAIVVSGCICPSNAPEPSLLGIGHQYWMVAGLVGFPILLGLAALIPSRRTAVEMPLE
jgi:hypothetical protein